jgi:hypothetical protein
MTRGSRSSSRRPHATGRATPLTTHPTWKTAACFGKRKDDPTEWDDRNDRPSGDRYGASDPPKGERGTETWRKAPTRRGDPAWETNRPNGETRQAGQPTDQRPATTRGASNRPPRRWMEAHWTWSGRQGQEGKGCGDAVRLSTRGILRRVRAAPGGRPGNLPQGRPQVGNLVNLGPAPG